MTWGLNQWEKEFSDSIQPRIELTAKACEELTAKIREHYDNIFGEKEATTMKVEYNGFTGELVKLERKLEPTVVLSGMTLAPTGSIADIVYDISIYDDEKKATISFENVKRGDFKFLGVEVSFT